jgi:CRP-like cAMP-binding protein
MTLDPSAFVAEPDLIRVLWLHAIPLDFAEEHELFCQGDDPTGLYILHSGDVTMILENGGGVQVLAVSMAPGSILGLPALVSDEPYSMTAVARKGAVIGFVNRDDFSVLMLGEPLLALTILRVLAAEVRSTRVAMSKYQAPSQRRRGLRRKRPRPEIRAKLRTE